MAAVTPRYSEPNRSFTFKPDRRRFDGERPDDRGTAPVLLRAAPTLGGEHCRGPPSSHGREIGSPRAADDEGDRSTVRGAEQRTDHRVAMRSTRTGQR